jgi:hypothetical protein
MRDIIKEIFGKNQNLSKEDIEKYIIQAKPRESAILEYKSTEKLKKDRQGRLIDEKGNEKKEVIIKPLISFLNKFSPEGGLLVLGIYDQDGIPQKISVSKDKLFTEEQLRNLIHTEVDSIPKFKDFPLLNIQNVDVNNGEVWLIEIHPIDFNTVYFSRSSNYAYVRKNDTSQQLSLPETIELIKQKMIAKVFISPEITHKQILDNSIEYTIEFGYINEGNKPGRQIFSILGFEGNISIGSLYRLGWGRANYQHPFELNLNGILYPKLTVRHIAGSIQIKFSQEDKIKLETITFEEEGFSIQNFIISKDGLEEVKREFTPYIML